MIVKGGRDTLLKKKSVVAHTPVQVKLDPPPRRPSGLLLDQENGDVYLLNLQVPKVLLSSSHVLLPGRGCCDAVFPPNRIDKFSGAQDFRNFSR